jgi:glycerol-3-phosphate acyltransferase PlsY
VQQLLTLLLAYLVGSVNFGVIVPRLKGIDIHERGSGNPGASNVLRTVGKRAGAVVLIGDAAKGVVGAALGAIVVNPEFGYVTALAAVVGHVVPVWHRFRGGRGVATALGAALYLQPIVGVVLMVLWAGILIIWKTASIASLVAMVLYVPGFWLAGVEAASLAWAAAIAVLVVLRHAGNIRRLVGGSERSVAPG